MFTHSLITNIYMHLISMHSSTSPLTRTVAVCTLLFMHVRIVCNTALFSVCSFHMACNQNSVKICTLLYKCACMALYCAMCIQGAYLQALSALIGQWIFNFEGLTERWLFYSKCVCVFVSVYSVLFWPFFTVLAFYCRIFIYVPLYEQNGWLEQTAKLWIVEEVSPLLSHSLSHTHREITQQDTRKGKVHLPRR